MKKRSKLLAAAIAIIGFSTAASITGTVAWFTASNLVTATGMSIQAQAEQGIVISNEAKSDWKTTANASHNGSGATFVPTSSKNLTTWYHGYADDINNGQSGVAYTTITIVDSVASPAQGADDDGVFGFNENNVLKNVYLLNKFYIQSSSAAAINTQDIYVQDLTVSGSSASVELNKSLRVGILHDSVATIFAPMSGATASYMVNGATYSSTYDVVAITDTAADSAGTTAEVANSVNIPAYAADGAGALEFDVFVYFEGEDAACKSANIKATLDTLSLSLKFGNKAHD